MTSSLASPQLSRTPAELNELRESVETWLKKGAESLQTFYWQSENNGTYLLDTKPVDTNPGTVVDDEPFNTTTTARAYKAMVCASWRMAGAKGFDLRSEKNDKSKKPLYDKFKKFAESKPYVICDQPLKPAQFLTWPPGKGAKIDLSSDMGKKCLLNNFDVVHLADFVYAIHYLTTYEELGADDYKDLYRLATPDAPAATGTDPWTVGGSTKAVQPIRDLILEMLRGTVKDKHAAHCGKVPLEPNTNTHHFFVTLHALRALSILDDGKRNVMAGDADNLVKMHIVESCMRFCMEQCFYASRGGRHEFDCTSLVFALVIYISYSGNCDKDLVLASLDAIAHAQTTDGNWPASYPIMRGGGSKPWHITSHELALSLSWLYFEPRLPDSGRVVVLDMLERYFRNWVMKTHVTTKVNVDGRGRPTVKDVPTKREFSGWFDDHTISRDTAAAWVTAIVCDFLGNYHHILCDYTNRRVIETLGIETSAFDYLIGEDAPQPAKKWKTYWPDLPPRSWPDKAKTVDELANSIALDWTDPLRSGPKTGIAYCLAERLQTALNCPLPKLNKSRNLEEVPRVFLLPGPPGTRKTSLVKSVRGLAGWPLITVPAATFFEDGFDHLLTRATYVFSNLGYLRQCTIFFDEFEEFFRERFGAPATNRPADKVLDEFRHRIVGSPKNVREAMAKADGTPGDGHAEREFHDRTIAAFITSSMLPHLQQLHDDGNCFVFVATNSERTIDRAIQRPGRFDLRIEVPHPTVACVCEFLKSPTKKSLETLEIDIPEDAKTGADLANVPKWKLLAADMEKLLEDPAWKAKVFGDLQADIKLHLGAETDIGKVLLADLEALRTGGVARLDERLCVPFRDVEEALRLLKRKVPPADVPKASLERRLDSQVDDLIRKSDK